MLVHRRVTPSIFASTHLYTWVERGTVRVKCLAQEHNTMSPARTRTRTTRSRVKCTDHEATAPPTHMYQLLNQYCSCYSILLNVDCGPVCLVSRAPDYCGVGSGFIPQTETKFVQEIQSLKSPYVEWSIDS